MLFRSYVWDVGLHYVGGAQNSASLLRRTLDYLTDGTLAWQPLPEVYDRAFVGERRYDFVAGTERFRARMHDYFPRDGRAIDRYIKAVCAAARAVNAYSAEKVLPPALSAVAGGALRLPFLHWARRTTAEILDALTDNRELKGVLAAQWGDYGLPPGRSSFGIHAVIVHSYLEGAAYPVGGAASLATAMAPVLAQSGGRIVVDAPVAAVAVEQGKAVGVRMEDGREFRAPVVLSDAGFLTTLNELVPPDAAGAEKLRRAGTDFEPSASHVCLYVGMRDVTPEASNLWLFPSYDHDENAARFERDPEAPFPFLYVSFPSAKDPEFARSHPGRATAEVMALMPYRLFSGWEKTRWKKRPADYEAFKRRLTDRLQEALLRRLPEVAGRIEIAELSTPITTRHFTRHQMGAIYGIAATPLRFANRSLKPRTPISGLFLTGQDAALPGITGALVGGILAASAVLKRNLMAVVTTAKPPTGSH